MLLPNHVANHGNTSFVLSFFIWLISNYYATASQSWLTRYLHIEIEGLSCCLLQHFKTMQATSTFFFLPLEKSPPDKMLIVSHENEMEISQYHFTYWMRMVNMGTLLFAQILLLVSKDLTIIREDSLREKSSVLNVAC